MQIKMILYIKHILYIYIYIYIYTRITINSSCDKNFSFKLDDNKY